MGEPNSSAGACGPTRVRLQREIENILGTWLPDCSTILVTKEGGIRAEQIDTLDNKVVKEIEGNGDVYFSNKCGEQWEGRYWDGFPYGLKCVSTKRRIKYTYSVAPSKLAEARALLLKAQKPEIPQLETPPAVVQKNP